jgi:hypothetical protein
MIPPHEISNGAELLTFLATDDSYLVDVNKDKESIHKVGEITVRIYRGGEFVDLPDYCAADDEISLDGISTVHEKALKGQAKSRRTLCD